MRTSSRRLRQNAGDDPQRRLPRPIPAGARGPSFLGTLVLLPAAFDFTSPFAALSLTPNVFIDREKRPGNEPATISAAASVARGLI
jgi:hypothetical protein